jgi:hypothetical protein
MLELVHKKYYWANPHKKYSVPFSSSERKLLNKNKIQKAREIGMKKKREKSSDKKPLLPEMSRKTWYLLNLGSTLVFHQ